MPTCKGCNAEILWVKTKDGKNMPLDPIPFKAAVLTGAPDRRVAEIVNAFTPHWATCPKAAQFKKQA